MHSCIFNFDLKMIKVIRGRTMTKRFDAVPSTFFVFQFFILISFFNKKAVLSQGIRAMPL